MNLFNIINLPVFIISLAIGIFVTYITIPNTQKIIVYPNPDNIDKLLYKDNADNCFQFSSKEVKCPTDESKIRSYDIQ
jgi:hypothetical protein